MKGDILIIDENHIKAAREIAQILLKDIQNFGNKYVITVAGESGAGKSEVAYSIVNQLADNNISTYVFGQDDYFRLPPKTNARQRAKDISWVGVQEVRLDMLDKNIHEALHGKTHIVKPLVDFNADSIGEETIALSGYRVFIAEGTYTTLLKNVNCRIFIDRNKMDTLEARKKRAREKQDDFLEQILTIEHDIISKHKIKADIIISKDWEVNKVR